MTPSLSVLLHMSDDPRIICAYTTLFFSEGFGGGMYSARFCLRLISWYIMLLPCNFI